MPNDQTQTTDENGIRWFPVLHSKPHCSVLWSKIAPHEAQARANHGGQSLEKLASRGGLDWTELLAVLEDRPWRKMSEAEAIKKVRAYVE